MTPEEVEKYFIRNDGAFSFARWGRSVAPVVFGLDEKSLSILKGAIEAVMSLTNRQISETDPELGANFMFFFFSEKKYRISTSWCRICLHLLKS